jgi:hypothetical protein
MPSLAASLSRWRQCRATTPYAEAIMATGNSYTTAKLRSAALDMAQQCQWGKAADLMQLAIDRYPPHPDNAASCIADKDIMQKLVAEWWQLDHTRMLRIYTYGHAPDALRPRLDATHSSIANALTDAEIIKRFGICEHWRAEVEDVHGIRVIQQARFNGKYLP